MNKEINFSHKENKPMFGKSGVYFLFYKEDIVYVGQSKNIEERIKAHQADNEKNFNSWNCIYLKHHQLNNTEAFYILSLLPIYNKTIPKNKRFFTFNKLYEIASEEENIIQFPTAREYINKMDHFCILNEIEYYDIEEIAINCKA